MKKNSTHAFGKTAVSTLITAVLALSPTVAFAVASDAATANATAQEQAPDDDYEGCEEMSNEEYVNSLAGLTDAERTELLELYNKWDALWESDDEDADLTEAEYARMFELQDKAYFAEAEKNLTADELAEFKSLWERIGIETEDLFGTDDWNRLVELENKAFGYADDYGLDLGWDDWGDSDWEDLSDGGLSNEEYVATLKGLTDEERTELVALYDKLDALWESDDENADLTEAEWQRLNDLEDKAIMAELEGNLSADEMAELKGLWNKLETMGEDTELTDAEWDRMLELETKGFGIEDELW